VAYRATHGKAQEEFPGLHELLVSEELWAQCQTVRESRPAEAEQKWDQVL
jgi:hypothetical protein